MSSVYENIKNRRLKLGISQSELASLAGYSGKSMISRIENGEIDLSIDKLRDIAVALNCQVADLWDWSAFDYLDSGTEDAELLKEFHRMTPAQQQSVRNYMKFIVSTDNNPTF